MKKDNIICFSKAEIELDHQCYGHDLGGVLEWMSSQKRKSQRVATAFCSILLLDSWPGDSDLVVLSNEADFQMCTSW